MNKQTTSFKGTPSLWLVFLLLAYIPSAVQATDDWYLGGGAGISEVLIDGFDQGTQAQLFGGLKVTDKVYGEAGLISLGEFESQTDADDKVVVEGLTLALKGENMLNDQVRVHVKFGAIYWMVEPTVSVGTTSLDLDTEKGFGVWGGFGFSWYITRNFAAWAAVDYYYDIDSIDLNTGSVGLQFSF